MEEFKPSNILRGHVCAGLAINGMRTQDPHSDDGIEGFKQVLRAYELR